MEVGKKFFTNLLLFISCLGNLIFTQNLAKVRPKKPLFTPPTQFKQRTPILDRLARFLTQEADFFVPKYDDEFISKEQCDVENDNSYVDHADYKKEKDHSGREWKGKEYWIGCYWNPKEFRTDFWIKNYYWKLLDQKLIEFNKQISRYLGLLGIIQLEFENPNSSKHSTKNTTKISLRIDNNKRKWTSLTVSTVVFQIVEAKKQFSFILNVEQTFQKELYQWKTYDAVSFGFDHRWNKGIYWVRSPYFYWLETNTIENHMEYFDGFLPFPTPFPEKSPFDQLNKRDSTWLGFPKTDVFFNWDPNFIDDEFYPLINSFYRHLAEYHRIRFWIENSKITKINLNSVKITYFFQFNTYVAYKNEGEEASFGEYMIYKMDENGKEHITPHPENRTPIKNPYRNDGKWVLD